LPGWASCTWKSWSTGLPRLSIGALATDPADGSVWVGLGEANTAFENFNAFGVYRPDKRDIQRIRLVRLNRREEEALCPLFSSGHRG